MAPILTYKDLSRHDIADLTSILNRSPHLPTLANDAVLRQQIRDLPPHLKSIIPCIAPGCPVHKRLNTLPLDDLAATLRHEITVCVPQTWFPLRDAGKLSAEQTYALGMLDAIANLSITGCAACWLEALASHVEGSIALGAVIIGRVSPGIYEKSKRVLWIEEGVRVCAGERGVRRMWELGMRFRGLRKENAGVGKGRGFVGDYVRMAREMGRQSGESSGSAQGPVSSHGRSAAMEAENWDGGLPMDETEARSTSTHRFDQRFPAPSVTASPSHAAPPTAQPPISGQPPYLQQPSQPQPRMASSIYSHHTTTPYSPAGSSHSSWWNSSSNSSRSSSTASSTGTQIIDLYRHSEFPKNVGQDINPSIPSPVYGTGVYYQPPRPRPSMAEADVTDSSRQTDGGARGNRNTIYERRMESRGVGIVIGGRPHVNTRGLGDVR